MVDPGLRNIHLIYNKGCRRALARPTLQRIDPHGADALFVNDAKYDSKYRFAISIVDTCGTVI